MRVSHWFPTSLVVVISTLLLTVPSPVRAAAAAEKPKKVEVVKRTLTIEFKAPDGGWVAEVDEVWRVQEELVVVVITKRPQGVLAAKMISTVTAEVTEKFPVLPVRGLVLGKTWKWENENPGVIFVTEESPEYKARRQGKRLWRRPPPPDDVPRTRE